MTAAIIAGSLVDVRNVGTHKSVKLTVHVPAELAQSVFAAFGWPTGVAPVEVAIARLNPEAANRKDGEVHQTSSVSEREQPGRNNTLPRPSVVPASAAGADMDIPPELDQRRKSPAQIAGYLCTQEGFRVFLRQKFPDEWHAACDAYADEVTDDVVAAECVRGMCNVQSRADITQHNVEWHALLLAFRLWENHPELEDA